MVRLTGKMTLSINYDFLIIQVGAQLRNNIQIEHSLVNSRVDVGVV